MKSMFQIIATLACALALTACGGGSDDDTAAVPADLASGLIKTDTVVGTGIEATAGDQVSVYYTGYLYDSTKADGKGAKFETTATGSPFTFVLGRGTVITGWDQGIAGMRVGGKRTLTIPYALAYGSASRPAGALGVAIPSYAPLVFDVEMVAIKR